MFKINFEISKSYFYSHKNYKKLNDTNFVLLIACQLNKKSNVLY